DRLPNNQRVAGHARGTGAKIQTEQHDAQIFIDGRDAISYFGELGNLLRFDVGAVGPKHAAGAGHELAIFEAVRVTWKRGVDRDEAACLETCRIKLGDPGPFFARIAL